MAASSSTSASSASTSANPKSNSNSSYDIFINHRAPSANPKSNSNSSYDIFINHRAPDVKNTFGSYLYRRLLSHGLKVFLDREELQRGDCLTSEIEGAIQSASVHVAIFSARYAESPWCLNELVSMVETKKPIIPVFYGVKPAELRWTEGTDGTQRYDSVTVQNWRNALSSVAVLSDFELETFKGDEGELLEKVVASVLSKVKIPLKVAKYATALDEKVEEFQNKVLSSGRKVQLIGVVGPGGIGKTTLAKEFFNLKSSNYKSSCFLADVRENVNRGCLTKLQSKLLESLTGSYVQIDNQDEGREKLKRYLSTSPILLILDDVDHVDQVHSLLPYQTSLHSNSLILITSRNKKVLAHSGVEESSIYKLDGLSTQHSLELFCWYAFSQPYPLPEFESLTRQFIKACQGLPLSLKVLGALLHGQNDTSYWREQLDRLNDALPSEIQQSLRISYDSLSRAEQEIFLDIACFLIGHDRDKAIRIWDASGLQGGSGFKNLQDRCMVEVEVAVEWGSMYQIHKINMHDLLRDLGREIAESSLPRRIWRCTENVIDDLLQQSSVITVRGIRMVLSEYHKDDEFDSIEMRRLQLVDTEGFLLERILRRVKSPNLIWLCWKECPHSSVPSWIPVNNLRVLEVSGSTLETLWQQESQWPVCLEVLRVDGCKKLEIIRGLEQATKLQRLHVSGCSELEALPSLEALVSLEVLQVDGCKKLKALPSLEALVSLEVLQVDGCKKLKTIRGLEQATKLQRLHVSGCSELEELPSLEALVSLEVLWAWGCVKLKSIRGFEQATQLRRLDVGGCSELEALPSMERLVSLEQLRAEGCVKLKRIQGLEQATKLRWLDVRWCSKLEALPSMETMRSLEELRAAGCMKLKSVRGLEQATKLRLLDIGGCCELEALSSMETLASLEELWAEGCVKLKSIRGISQCIQLRKLSVSRCCELEEVEGTWLERFDYEYPNLQWRRQRS